MTRTMTIGVTGLNATDNPAPGVGVLRCLREGYGAGAARPRLVGLAYDALDPGLYARDWADDVFLVPYPSQGIEAFLARLAYVKERTGLDVVVPTLDAELPSFIDAGPELRRMGIRTFLPSREQLELRAKSRLDSLGRSAGLPVPKGGALAGVEDLATIHERIAYPFFIKGNFYGATLVHDYHEAVTAYWKVIAQWGAPVIVQARVHGEEFDVVAVGDGEGGLVGAVPMKKMVLTDKGKGWAGITIKDPGLLDLTDRFMRATKWRGGCELEVMRDAAGNYNILEINPRFPAWVYLSAAAGLNLPAALVELACGRPVERRVGGYEVGRIFVRISVDQVIRSEDFQGIVTAGEVMRGGDREAGKVASREINRDVNHDVNHEPGRMMEVLP